MDSHCRGYGKWCPASSNRIPAVLLQQAKSRHYFEYFIIGSVCQERRRRKRIVKEEKCHDETVTF